tara:strand:- start:170 stop:388 length:219 start_codon:yes stop_codon:yes gene_type:complete
VAICFALCTIINATGFNEHPAKEKEGEEGKEEEVEKCEIQCAWGLCCSLDFICFATRIRQEKGRMLLALEVV